MHNDYKNTDSSVLLILPELLKVYIQIYLQHIS